jgi:uncharacterized protein with HEPN domain
MQQHNKFLKYILDIEGVVLELEKIIEHHNSDYHQFINNFIAVRAVERDLMIIGEAVGQLLKLDSTITITSAKHIIGLRNIIVHAYDAIDPATLWKILIKDLPTLKTEISDLKSGKSE